MGANQERYTATYDGSGTRVSSRQDGVDHVYSYGGGSLLHDSAGDTSYTPGISRRKGGVDRCFHSDWIGSTRYPTDGTGLQAPSAKRYDAFGNVSASGGTDSTIFGFASAVTMSLARSGPHLLR